MSNRVEILTENANTIKRQSYNRIKSLTFKTLAGTQGMASVSWGSDIVSSCCREHTANITWALQ